MSEERPLPNPYVGPRTFAYEQRHLFFGREREARDLLARVLSERLLLFYAQSGAGKSSLLHTRLIPQLQEEKGFIVLPVARVSGELPGGIEDVDNIYAFNLMLSIDQGDEPARLAQLTIDDFLARLTRRTIVDAQGLPRKDWVYDAEQMPASAVASANSRRYTLIVDQFEEIITAYPERWRERESFFRQLDQAMQRDPNLWVVLTLREDYVTGLEPYAPLLADQLRARFHMERMDVATALAAIRQPAALAGRPFAPDVAEKLVDDLRQARVPGRESTVPGQYVEPVQLQVVCYQLWENLAGEPGGLITEDKLTEAGDVDQSLTNFYKSALNSIIHEPTLGISESQLREWFADQLITDANTRSTVYRDEQRGESGGLPNKAVDILVRHFLVRIEQRAGGYWVELVHDRFVGPILRSNQEWLNQQSPLIQAARNWEESRRNPELLLADHQLELAQREISSGKPDSVLSDYLRASQAAAQARVERIVAQQREIELEHARRLAYEADARRQAETQRALEAEARQREQEQTAAQLRRRAFWLGIMGVLALGLMVTAIWFAINIDRARQEAERAALAIGNTGEWASISQFQLEAAETEVAKARAAAEQERNSALQLAATLHSLLLTPTETSALLATPSPAGGEREATPAGTSVYLIPSATPTANLAATADTNAVIVEINQIQERATQSAPALPQAAPEQPALYALAPAINISIFAGPDIGEQVLATVHSPVRMPVQEISSEWTKVQTEEGISGWIRSGFVTYEGDPEAVPLELRYRIVSDRTDLPFIDGQIISYGGARGDYLYGNPADELSGFRWIAVGTPVTVLQIGEGIRSYGSGRWAFVSLVDPDNENRLLQGWIPWEVLAARPAG